PDQLVVFRQPVGARQGAGLDLAGIGGDREIGDRRILGFAGAVRENHTVPGAYRDLDGVERLAQRADLVDLDEQRVADTAGDALLEARGVRYKHIVADKLDLLPELAGQQFPTCPVVFRHAVLDRQDRVARA